MEKLGNLLGLSHETISTIVGSVLTILSIFLAVSLGYYLYHYIFDRKK